MDSHYEKLDNLMTKLQADSERGLTTSQVIDRKAEYGENRLREKKRKTLLQHFFDQFKDVMILILIAAAAVSFIIACTQGELREFFEPILILLIVVLNAIMGVLQENKAERALEALKKMSALRARVIRDGKEEMIDSAELVPGDIIRLVAGDFVPADARLISSASLKSEESSLTGESVPSEKDSEAQVDEKAPLGDRTNMVFSGCSITYGSALAVVTATGMNTEMGKIAGLLENAGDTATPLQKKLAKLGKSLGLIALLACVVVFVIGIIDNIPILEIFMISVSLAVSAIPEGLPAIVTIVLSIGVQRMVKRNAIIRRLPAVETLGGASVICSDKTGTLTQNRMTLVKAYVDGAKEPEDIGDENSEQVKKLLTFGTLCSDGTITETDAGVEHLGDPTETSIVYAAYRNKIIKEQISEAYPRLGVLPFDSERKLMTTINKIESRTVVIVKGAFDVLSSRCIHGNISAADEINNRMASNALRVLAIAYKEIDHIPAKLSPEELESGLTFVGIVGMIDPPRPEAQDAVAVCRKAGIIPVMITGDHVATASAIAKEIGILQEGGIAITGAELDAMDDEEFDGRVRDIAVYARVSPENKIRIVRAWQRQGEIVSMTGDGVNDAPALKAADIGCAMGITGTDVAKGAADMTLTDDNFATIVEAVKEGRGIYANIKKVIGYLLGTNFGEILTVFFAMILWRKSPLISMQLLWINLVTDSLPAIALGMETVEKGVMDQKPRPKNEGIFAHGTGLRIGMYGFLFAIVTLIAFKIGEQMAGEAGGRTMAFMVLAFSQIVQSFNMRSYRSLFAIGPFSNRNLNIAAITSSLLMVIVLFTPLSVAFELILMPAGAYLIGIALSLVSVPLLEIAKALKLIK